jgi:hypothetical protein
MPGHMVHAACDACGYQSSQLSVGAANDRKLYVAAFDPGRGEIVCVDKVTATERGWTMFRDPWLDDLRGLLRGEPYQPARGDEEVFGCPLCGKDDLRFYRVGNWD